MKKNLGNWLPALLLPLFLMAAAARLSAQDYSDSTLLVVKLKSGAQLVGFVVKKTRDTVYFKNQTGGEITIPRSEIRLITRYQIKNVGQYWRDSPLETTQILCPSGFGLKKGTGFVRSYAIYVGQINYVLTDHVSIGAGGLIFPLKGPSSVSIKFSAPYRSSKGSVALLCGYLFNDGNYLYRIASSADMPFVLHAVNSWGRREKQLTIGTGYYFLKNNPTKHQFFHSIAFQIRRGKWGFFTENCLFLADDGLFVPTSFCGRFYAQRSIIEFGLLTNYFNTYTDRSFQDSNREFYPALTVTVPFLFKKSKIQSFLKLKNNKTAPKTDL